MVLVVVSGGVAGPELDPTDVRGTTSDRRLAIQRRASARQRLEPSTAGRQPRRRRSLPLHRQHQARRQQSRLSPRHRSASAANRLSILHATFICSQKNKTYSTV